MDENWNRINKLVGVAGLITLIGIELLNKFIPALSMPGLIRSFANSVADCRYHFTLNKIVSLTSMAQAIHNIHDYDSIRKIKQY